MRAAQNEPKLVLKRATTLLACICLLRLQCAQWTDCRIADYLKASFPEIAVFSYNVETLFRATCRNRLDLGRDMRQVHDPLQLAITHDMLEALQYNMQNDILRLTLERTRDTRATVKC